MGMNCNQCANNTNVIIAAIIALILINILDKGCIDSLSNLLVAIGDLMQVGNTSSCLPKCRDMRDMRDMRDFCC